MAGVIVRLLIIVLLLIPGLAVSKDGNKKLSIYNWSDYIDPNLIKEFEKETGIKV